MDERWLAALGHGKLRHFVVDGNTILSLLEEPLANSQEPQPTIVGKSFGLTHLFVCGKVWIKRSLCVFLDLKLSTYLHYKISRFCVKESNTHPPSHIFAIIMLAPFSYTESALYTSLSPFS